METATRAQRDPMRADEPPPPSTARRVLDAAAGPALIVVSVLIALRGFAFLPNLSDQHPDILSFWLPRSCMLGRAIADGHVPLWNPFEMSGTWFAADPQSGWLSLPTMASSWLFGCGGGLRALIVLNPILAGLGLFWFLRKEGLGRIAATAGGLSLAMAVSASILAISLPFAGTLAWTPFLLTGASGFFGRTGWRRLAWLALAAFAWGQVATAHLSHGLVMATVLVVAYVIARAIREVRRARSTPAPPSGGRSRSSLFLPLANLAIVVPHFAVLARSSLSDGYGAIVGTVARPQATSEDIPIAATGMWGAWPLALASTPGGYLGAAVLLFVPFALRDAARRYLVVALGAVAVLAYLLTNTVLVGAGWFRSLALSLPFGDVYLHNPSRLRYLAFLIVPALGAVGIQWFLDHRPGFGEAMRWIGAGLVVFLVFPLVMGARPGRLVIFAVAGVAVVGVVWAFARGRRWAPVALCAILAAELLTGAIWSSMYHGGTVYLGLETGSHAALVAAPLRWPDVDVHEYLSPGPIARTLQRSGPSDGRYLAWIRPDAYFNKGYLFTRKESDWPALLIGRSVLFQIPDTLGYSPVQLPGYWAYVHATNRLPLFYNAAAIQVPTLTDLRLLGARYLIVPQGISARRCPRACRDAPSRPRAPTASSRSTTPSRAPPWFRRGRWWTATGPRSPPSSSRGSIRRRSRCSRPTPARPRARPALRGSPTTERRRRRTCGSWRRPRPRRSWSSATRGTRAGRPRSTGGRCPCSAPTGSSRGSRSRRAATTSGSRTESRRSGRGSRCRRSPGSGSSSRCSSSRSGPGVPEIGPASRSPPRTTVPRRPSAPGAEPAPSGDREHQTERGSRPPVPARRRW